jgi:hypothetical protein
VVRSGGEGASRLGFGGFIAASHRGGRGGRGDWRWVVVPTATGGRQAGSELWRALGEAEAGEREEDDPSCNRATLS